MSNKKGLIKIIIGIIAVVVLIVVGFFATKLITSNTKENDLKNKLSEINASELEIQLIDELKDSSINVKRSANNSSGNVIGIKTLFNRTKELAKTDKEFAIYDGYVLAAGWGTKNGELTSVEYLIPCFKIEEDNNGNVKSITYLYSEDKSAIEYVIAQTIEKYMQKKYDIDISKQDKKFIKDEKNSNVEISANADYVLDYIIQDITGASYYKEHTIYTRTFGIDIK